MYDLDEFIARLQELRMVAKAGGETPVAVHHSDGGIVPASVGFLEATPRMRGEELVEWLRSPSSNTTEIVRVF
jgi:hypothetical protein